MSLMGAPALYGTIWLSLVLFVAGEIGKRAPRYEHIALRLWIAGALACGVHMTLAMAGHDWDSGRAVAATAAQVEAVFGLRWGAGYYLNYVFLALWSIEAVWWRMRPASYLGRPRAVLLPTRIFYFVILLNAAVIFVPPHRRAPGALLLGALLWAWRPVQS